TTPLSISGVPVQRLSTSILDVFILPTLLQVSYVRTPPAQHVDSHHYACAAHPVAGDKVPSHGGVQGLQGRLQERHGGVGRPQQRRRRYGTRNGRRSSRQQEPTPVHCRTAWPSTP